ncbi:MAG TPA: hypothetical protein VN868_00770, partial [Terriglobales bacterium]|nr:hypothetical protein [Terriglobales bacterium]
VHEPGGDKCGCSWRHLFPFACTWKFSRECMVRENRGNVEYGCAGARRHLALEPRATPARRPPRRQRYFESS